jgi:hypothetical protein
MRMCCFKVQTPFLNELQENVFCEIYQRTFSNFIITSTVLKTQTQTWWLVAKLSIKLYILAAKSNLKKSR